MSTLFFLLAGMFVYGVALPLFTMVHGLRKKDQDPVTYLDNIKQSFLVGIYFMLVSIGIKVLFP